MALSTLTFAASRGRGPYAIHGLDYLSTAHLAVTVNGTPVSATFDDATRTMTLAADPAIGGTIVVRRTTPRLQAQRLTQFLDLPTGAGGLTADLLDQDARQNMLLMGEGRDAADGLTALEGVVGLNAGGNWEGEALRLENLLAAEAPGDAVVKSQLDAVAAAARPLPVVTGADDNDGLFVSGGEWDDQSPTLCRTHLQLGTVAVLTAGVAANNVPQYDASARYPAASGALIDLTSHPTVNQRARATVVYLTTTTGITANNIDPTVGTWSQSADSRVGSLSTPWTNRVELNNSSAISAIFSPQTFTLEAGTWRIRYVANVRGPSGLFDPWAFRITDDDDTSAQVIYYDSGVLRLLKQPGGSNIRAFYSDEIVLSSATPFELVFRWAEPNMLGDAMRLRLFFHKLSTTTLISE